MALLAGHLPVLTGQGEFGFRVVEVTCIFPVHAVMTLRAVRPQLPFVLVLMTTRTASRQAKIRVAYVLGSESCALDTGNVGRIVAFVAGQTGMLAVQSKAAGGMIEFGWGGIPMQQAEVNAVMLGMAADA